MANALAKAGPSTDAVTAALAAGLDLAPVELAGDRLDQHAPSAYLASLAEGSRRTMKGAIQKIAHILTGGRCNALTLPWGAIRWQHVNAVRAAVAERYAVKYARKIMAALRGVLKAAWRLGQIPTEDYHRAIDVDPIRGSSLPPGRWLSPGEIRSLFQACADDAEGSDRPTAEIGAARDAAMLAILYGCGLRRSEVVSLDIKDYNADSSELRVRSGKGNKERTAYLTGAAQEAVDEWLKWRGEAPGPLFWPMTRGGRLKNRRLHNQTVQDILERRLKQCGVAHCTPHDLRRTFISDLLDQSGDLAAVQKLAGHNDPSITSEYDRRGERAKRKAAEMIHVPFIRTGHKN